MAKTETPTVETPQANTPHPSEKMFMADHPELVVEKAIDKSVGKSAFEEGLDEAIEHVVEPKKEEKEESKEDVKPEESEDTPVEEQPSEEETKPSKASDDKKVVTADDDAIVKAYAEKNGITEEQARMEVDEYRAIARKYKNDPIELAKAYKNIQSESDKVKAQESQNQQARMVSNIMADPQAFVAKAEKENAPKWVEEYRRTYPNKSETMTDAAIVEECRQVALNQVKQQIGEYQIKLRDEASTRREQLIKQVKEQDRPFVSEIIRVLKGLPDIQVVDKNFNFNDLTRWARGDDKNIERLKKESYDQGFKAAKSGDIVGEIVIAKSTGGSKPKVKESRPAAEQLTDFQKRQAKEQYASIDGTDEDRYAAYIDVLKSRKK